MDFKTVIGLEVHVELLTKTKIFCACPTEFGGPPNTQCCPVCLGHPGTLPVLNKKVPEYAIKAGLVLGCDIAQRTVFDRKNYFYPDLPKAYQISQLYAPFATNGKVNIKLPTGDSKVIRIHEIHIEEDAGKLIHSETTNETLLDFNRSGVPLIEIVTEPDFNTADEVTAFLEKLKTDFEYLGISDCKMQEGSIRVDVNLSVNPLGSETLGTRTEMKNLNSFKAIQRAINHESNRQKEVVLAGGTVLQETRRWDDKNNTSVPMRIKETAAEYRYFPEPDLPILKISKETVQKYRAEIPELADQKTTRFVRDFGLSVADAKIIAYSKRLAGLFEDTVALGANPKEVRFFIIGSLIYILHEKGIEPESITLSAKNLFELIAELEADSISRSTAKDIFEVMLSKGEDFSVKNYINQNGLGQIEDADAIKDAAKKVMLENPGPLEQYKKGQTKVVGFFVGQVMKLTGGKAKPETVNKIVGELLADIKGE